MELLGLVATAIRVTDYLSNRMGPRLDLKTAAVVGQLQKHLKKTFEILTPDVPWPQIVLAAIIEHGDAMKRLAAK